MSGKFESKLYTKYMGSDENRSKCLAIDSVFTHLCIRVFDTLWSIGEIGSTMVSVCAIGNTSWAN